MKTYDQHYQAIHFLFGQILGLVRPGGSVDQNDIHKLVSKAADYTKGAIEEAIRDDAPYKKLLEQWEALNAKTAQAQKEKASLIQGVAQSQDTRKTMADDFLKEAIASQDIQKAKPYEHRMNYDQLVGHLYALSASNNCAITAEFHNGGIAFTIDARKK